MKRLFLFQFFIIIILVANAQLINPYFQLEAGVAVNHKNIGLFCLELGSNYKFIDIGLAIDYESNSFFKEYTGEINIYNDEGYNPDRNLNDEFSYFDNTSLQLVSRIDIVKLFTGNSLHAFKIGGGYGIIHYKKTSSINSHAENSNKNYTLIAKSYFGLLGSYKISYEYKLKPELIVGTYFGGTFYPSVGILIRSNI